MTCEHGGAFSYIGQPDSDEGPSTGDPNIDVTRCAICDMKAWRSRSDQMEGDLHQARGQIEGHKMEVQHQKDCRDLIVRRVAEGDLPKLDARAMTGLAKLVSDNQVLKAIISDYANCRSSWGEFVIRAEGIGVVIDEEPMNQRPLRSEVCKALEATAELLAEANKRIDTLEQAIFAVTDERGHARCWVDFVRLYQVAKGVPPNEVEFVLPPKAEFMKGCEHFHEVCQPVTIGFPPSVTTGDKCRVCSESFQVDGVCRWCAEIMGIGQPPLPPAPNTFEFFKDKPEFAGKRVALRFDENNQVIEVVASGNDLSEVMSKLSEEDRHSDDIVMDVVPGINKDAPPNPIEELKAAAKAVCDDIEETWVAMGDWVEQESRKFESPEDMRFGPPSTSTEAHARLRAALEKV